MIAASQPRPLLHAVFAAGLAVMLLFTSTLVALRGVAMMNHLALSSPEVQVAAHGMEHEHGAKPKTGSHLEHCPLCFAQLVEALGIGAGLGKRLEVEHLKQLWLYAVHAKDEFLQGVAARGPPQVRFLLVEAALRAFLSSVNL